MCERECVRKQCVFIPGEDKEKEKKRKEEGKKPSGNAFCETFGTLFQC